MSQEGAMFLGELLSGPFRGYAGRGTEVFQVNFADGCPVVIAGNDDVRSFAQFDNAFVWVGAITDQVAEEPDLVDWLLLRELIDFCKYRFQAFHLAMSIRKNALTHILFPQ